MRTLFVILACSLWVQISRAQDWFWVKAKINGKPARLVLDTGCEPGLALFRHASERLNLKLQEGERGNADRIPYWFTEECTVKLPWSFWGFARGKGQLTVIEIPSYVRRFIDMDGAVGWPIVSQRVLELDAAEQKFRLIRKVPKQATGWTRLALQTNAPWGRLLALQMPQPDGAKEVIFVDTGSTFGVGLPPQKWVKWKTDHPNRPITFVAAYGPAPGMHVLEQSLATNIALGPMGLTDVVVGASGPMPREDLPADQTVTLGMAALKRLDFVIDGKSGVAYLRPKRTPVQAPSAESDRPALVFVPRDAKSDDLVAHVLEGSSTCQAGIRNGDLLLQLDERAVADWRANPGGHWRIKPDHPFIVASTNNPPGTRIEMTLKRGDETLKTAVDLKEIAIFAPQTNSPSSRSK